MSRRVLLGAAAAASILLLLVLGAALRPAVVPETASTAAALTPTEIGFVQDMTGHHQQALMMVDRLAADVDPTVRQLADQIADAQRLEIGMMLGWLRLAGTTPTNPHPMSWMPTGHHHAASATMPGMATRADLDALAQARGAEAETMFLRLMYRHHQGGVAMAQTFDELSTGGPVEQAARDMISTQSQESGLIGLLLSRRGAAATG
ncbi:DUF305 domain-containing protein [Nocardia asteroides NBRC 15531]|uniref:DUF305 domain-containing protein n=1 Tax=Nocardia asteroides TaxID=1824 RepID=UPI0004C1FBEF|nr:DUF305 domain-containing protein [Nocardia asteroides]TLF63333.1 DUF305 domain-containing protein [Nocardia asteroides NBRC 15531]UGT47244.1 DUF305 domain-containing protein [Nocardia asteroides]SFM75073.1 Uncharacterized conserved protein, DUF305 family [Nocardia asteroides]VEG33869.1 Uncharacterized protein conserved in bacteria [Nocardia asteroides]